MGSKVENIFYVPLGTKCKKKQTHSILKASFFKIFLLSTTTTKSIFNGFQSHICLVRYVVKSQQDPYTTKKKVE